MNRILKQLCFAATQASLRMRHALGALRLIRRAAGGWAIAWAVAIIVQGLVPAGIVLTTKWVVDGIAGALGRGLSMENVEPVIWPASIMALLILAQYVLQSLQTWIQAAQAELVQDEVKALIHRKSIEVDYGFYESPEFFDKLQEASSQASTRTLALQQNLGTLVQNGIAFLSMAAILASYSLWLPLLLGLGTLPALYVVVRHNRRYHAWWKRTTKDRRWAHYLDVLFIEPRFAAEMRLYDLGQYFMQEYRKTRGRLRTESLELTKKQSVASIIAALHGLVATAAVLGWMAWRAFQGLATLGDIASFYQAINQGQSLMRSLLGSMGQIYANTLFLEHLYAFLAIVPALDEPEQPLPVPSRLSRGIRFENVTFTYPEGKRPALENFNLEIPAGKIVAIVGSNGAGKSTLTKLLCRFYDPDQGRVLIDGIDVRSFSKRDLLSKVSYMLQTPVRYQATAYENIALGSRSAGEDAVVEAASRANADGFIKSLPQQYDTILGRLFPEGMDLSGGQWQRIALARAYLRRAPIVVLDEPTSAMDSWTEVEWMQGFKDLVRGRTAIVITHRFTTAMKADVIHVMERGRIVESGTHQELLALNGRYAVSWHAQMREANAADVDDPLALV